VDIDSSSGGSGEQSVRLVAELRKVRVMKIASVPTVMVGLWRYFDSIPVGGRPPPPRSAGVGDVRRAARGQSGLHVAPEVLGHDAKRRDLAADPLPLRPRGWPLGTPDISLLGLVPHNLAAR
jgi:hypothetical protein